MTESAAILTIVLPAVSAMLGLLMGKAWARDWAVLGSLGALVAAIVELVLVGTDGPVTAFGFLGRAQLGGTTIDLTLRSDQLSAAVAALVALVAFCVQIYSTAYLAGEGTPQAPTRYPAYAATVSLFTAAMMLVVHSADLVLLLIGWEIMGLASYLLVGHHSERAGARAAATKAFLVTRVGDIGVVLAVVVLIAGAGTTSISDLNRAATENEIGHGTVLTAGLLLLAGVVGKSAQFPLHIWLPDAMEGPTPVSALIHAATMVAAGVFLMARLLPLYLTVPGALQTGAVLASISMVGAALAALAQTDLKRLLAYSTISQVAYMLGAVCVASDRELGSGDPTALAAPGVLHLLSHGAFKALLFLAAGCIVHIVGSTALADMGGLWRTHRSLAVLFGIGLLGLAGIPPFGGFWSKEAVLSAADEAAHAGTWAGWTVLVAGVLTIVLTGLYAGRAWAIVAMGRGPVLPAVGDAETEEPHENAHGHGVPVAMMLPLYLLAIPTVAFGLVLLTPFDLLHGVEIQPGTAITGALLALSGVGWAVSAPRLGTPDIAVALPMRARSLLENAFYFDVVIRVLVVRPVLGLARTVQMLERDVVDAYVRGVRPTTEIAGAVLRRAQTGLATAYAAWVFVGAVVLTVAGMVLV
ncbi:proton-conducting transporter membrane subunit [Kineosporia sp. NBRC 101731]|uniref:NADH-quinone oxidoreductase subunit 5 family protein n=1 Tax=Kineosporia sp. NBRC 101731 TaxID=3032199 RepID=UPI0024A1059A|nr:proton-conducting transporter membrane subunit [Kineosporia sp. NBRC 101731]GLY27648.1 NADH dehydrogenase [Kineosporia sp. NBRC 101731]